MNALLQLRIWTWLSLLASSVLVVLPTAAATVVPGTAASSEKPELVVIGHADLPPLDLGTVRRLYTGRAVEVDGRPVVVVNLPSGRVERQLFMRRVMQQTEDTYRAYWTVRRHIGKGVPPHELADASAVQAFVKSTPGAVGYVLSADLLPGVQVIARP
jgi:hypothetical protein